MRAAGRPCWRLGAVVENGNSEDDEEDGKSLAVTKDNAEVSHTADDDDKMPVYLESGQTSENDDGTSGPWRYKELSKEYEPLKSVELLKNLEKNLSTYLPTYSIASDTESGEP